MGEKTEFIMTTGHIYNSGAAEFPQTADMIYLNHAAVSPWPRRSAEAVKAFANENVTHGARNYPRWLERELRLRHQLRRLLNAPSHEDIALAKNTSEALSFVAYGIDWQLGDNVVITDQEFPSNRIVWESLSTRGVEVRRASLSGDAEKNIGAAINQRTRLLSVSSVQYASGLRLDLASLGALCRDRGVAFCVDAIQSLGAIPVDVQAVQADFVMADAHKWLMGPEGIAVFYCSPTWREHLRLHEYGWHMVENMGDYDTAEWQVARSARRFECGSPNMLGIFALSASLELIEEIGQTEISERLLALTGYLTEALSEDATITLLSPREEHRRAGIVTFRPTQVDCAALVEALKRRGVICAYRGGGVRFSPHFYNTPEQLERALSILREEIAG